MNHPTSQADELLLLAQEALSDGDRDEAIAMLRKATREAPLRRDIRMLLANVLETSSISTQSSQTALPAQTSTTAERVSEVARNAFNTVASHTVQAGASTRNKFSTILNQGLKSLTTGDSVFTRPDKQPSTLDQATNSLPPSEARTMRIIPSAKSASVTASSYEVDDIMGELEAAGENSARSPVTPRRGLASDLDSMLAEVEAIPVKSSRERTSAKAAKRPADIEDAIGAVAVSVIGSWKNLGWKRFTYGLAFTLLAGYTIIACATTYNRFFSDSAALTGPQSRVPDTAVSLLADPPQLDLQASPEQLRILNKALSDARTGNRDDAIRQLSAIVSTDANGPTAQTASIELAMLLDKRGADRLVANRIAESVTDYRQALLLVPDSMEYQLRLANALYYAGTMVKDGKEKVNLGESGKLLEDVLRNNDSHLQAIALFANVNEALGKKELARRNWQRIKQLAPANSELAKTADSRLQGSQ